MKTFKLNPNGLKEIQRGMMLRTLPIVALLMAVAFFLTWNVQTGITIIVAIPLMLMAVAIGLFRGSNRQKQIWDTYTLVIDGEVITRTQDNTPAVTIRKEDVREIREDPQGALLLKTDQSTTFISIPAAISEREELVELLQQFGPMVRQAPKFGKSATLLPFLGIALMIAFFVSGERTIIIVSGTALTVLMLWSFFEIQRSKQIDRKTKRGSYMIFFVLFSVVLRFLAAFGVFGD